VFLGGPLKASLWGVGYSLGSLRNAGRRTSNLSLGGRRTPLAKLTAGLQRCT
jgi:hypothetical protein